MFRKPSEQQDKKIRLIEHELLELTRLQNETIDKIPDDTPKEQKAIATDMIMTILGKERKKLLKELHFLRGVIAS